MTGFSFFYRNFWGYLGWTYYSQKAVEYLGGKKAVVNLSLVWSFADIVNAFMAVPNLISLLLLSGVIVKETRKYLWNNRLDDYDDSLS